MQRLQIKPTGLYETFHLVLVGILTRHKVLRIQLDAQVDSVRIGWWEKFFQKKKRPDERDAKFHSRELMKG